MSSEVEFVDELPPPVNRAGVEVGKWVRVLSPLIERPGEWAIVFRHERPPVAATTAVNLRHHRVAVPPGNWEFVARTVEGEGRVYARYLNGETK